MVQNKPSLAPEDEAITFELDKKNGFNWLSHYDISIKDLLSDILKKEIRAGRNDVFSAGKKLAEKKM